MEIGVPVKPGTLPAGEAKIEVLPPYRCAALLLWGGMAYMAEAYGALKKAMQEHSSPMVLSGFSRDNGLVTVLWGRLCAKTFRSFPKPCSV